MVYSMTAFARYEKKFVWGDISWEIRSLNQRYLDIYVDMPKHLYKLSWDIRKEIKSFVFRGRIECFLHIEMNNITTGDFNINKQLVCNLITSAEWVKKHTKEGEINPLLVLSWPGVVTYKQNNVININLSLLDCFKKTLVLLIKDREKEGLFLKERIMDRLCCMREEVERLKCCIPDVLSMKRKKLLEQINNVCICVDDVKLEQELLMITQKIDISEEIDRLMSHIGKMYEILSQKGPSGRRLDFILQELYRESNTISSKSIDFNITCLAISLKVLIEQMREQVQNIE